MPKLGGNQDQIQRVRSATKNRPCYISASRIGLSIPFERLNQSSPSQQESKSLSRSSAVGRLVYSSHSGDIEERGAIFAGKPIGVYNAADFSHLPISLEPRSFVPQLAAARQRRGKQVAAMNEGIKLAMELSE